MRAVGIHTHFFLSFTFLPPPPRACVCVWARTRAGVKEGKRERSPSRPRKGGFRGGRKRAGVKEGSRAAGASGSSGANSVPYAAGNSHRCHLTYFDRSDRSGFGVQRPACGPTLTHVAAGGTEAGKAPAVASSAPVAGVLGHDGCNPLATPRQRGRGLPGTARRGRPRLGVVRRGWVGMGSAGWGRARRGMDAPRREGVAGAIGGDHSGAASPNRARSSMTRLGQAGRGNARKAPVWLGEARRGWAWLATAWHGTPAA